jgi:hypothetical protein
MFQSVRRSTSAMWRFSISTSDSPPDPCRRIALAVKGQIFDADSGRTTNDHGAFDRIGQFAYIPRPAVIDELCHGLVADPRDALVHLLGEALKEVLSEQRDVRSTGAQRRHLDGEDVDAVIEVLPESAPPRSPFTRSSFVAHITRKSAVMGR